MKEQDLHWLAGLMEGEGFFSKVQKSQKTYVAIEMTDEDVVNRVSKLLKVGVQEIPPRKQGYKTSYRCRVYGPKAIDLMKSLRPHMGKRRQAKIDSLLASYNPKKKILLDEEKAEILSLCKEGKLTQTEIGKRFHVSRETVNKLHSKNMVRIV